MELCRADGGQPLSSRQRRVIITLRRNTNRRCHIQPRSMDTRCTAGRVSPPAQVQQVHLSSSHDPLSLCLSQVCGQLSPPRLLPSSQTGSPSQRSDSGPAVSWNSCLTHRPVRTQTDQSQAGFLGSACPDACSGGLPKTLPTVMSHRE